MLHRVFVVSLLLLDACAPAEVERASAVREPIVNGTREPMALDLTPSQVRAIGWLYAGSPSSPTCTGTLIAPDIVVTAAHCVGFSGAGAVGFGVGLEPSAYEAVFSSVGVFRHPERDAAVIILSEDATARVDVTPIPVNQNALDTSMIGRAVQAGGYGDTRDATRTGRWFATVYVGGVSSEEVVVDGRGVQGICYGDSGSGLIDVDADGNPVVLAVESWGDESCVDVDHMTRLDTIYDWIGPILAGELPPDPCEGVGSEGRCVGDVSERCARGGLRRVDCSAYGAECGYVEGRAQYRCLCGSLTYEGRCDGDVVEYCAEGALIARDCSFAGGTCGWFPPDGYACGSSPSCRPEDVPGRCDGDVAIRCAAGVTTRELCGVGGLTCVETAEGVTCAEPMLDPPDAGTDAGPPADAGPPEAPAPDGGGCACSAASPAGSALWGVLVLLALSRPRRRG